jgi:cytochrome c5
MKSLLKISLLSIITSALILSCAVQKTIEPEFPEAMLPHVKTEYAARYDKGQILYDMNCGKCHTTIIARKKIVPDFKQEQLRGYELRIANAQHEKNMPDSLVTEEELGIIMTFLMYKKKNSKENS